MRNPQKNGRIWAKILPMYTVLSNEDIQKIMRLSRLDLTPEEQEKYKKDLSGILDFFEKLKEVDTNGIEPTAQVTGLKDILRTDEVENFPVGDLLKCSPQTVVGNQVSVPAVF